MFARSDLWATSISSAKAFALYGKTIPTLLRTRKILIISLQSGAVPKVMTATLNVVVSINSTTVMQTYWTVP